MTCLRCHLTERSTPDQVAHIVLPSHSAGCPVRRASRPANPVDLWYGP